MGKDSLIKSTAKQTKAEKEKEKSKKKSTKKAAPKSAAPKKAASKPTAKKQAKATKSTKTTKTTKSAKATKSAQKATKTAKKPAKKPTLKELIHKKFDGQMPPASDKPTEPDFSGMTAPPFINTDDPAEAERLKTLLSKKFDMAEIKASAKPPEARKVEIKEPAQPEPIEPEVVTETETVAEEPAPEPERKPQSAPAEPEQEKPVPVSEAVPEPPVKTEAPLKAELEAPKPVAAEPVQQETAPVPPIETAAAPVKEPVDPVLRAAKIAIIIAAAVVLMIVWASFKNSAKFFITSRGAAVMIEKGNFSPTGKSLFVVLHGFQLVDVPAKDTYRRNEIFPIIFGYYLNKADTLLEVAGLPDYKAINDDLEKAEQYALTGEMRDAVRNRMSYIQRMTLLYKAEVDASKTDIESLESALKRLKQVKGITEAPVQLEAINQKIATVTAALEAAKIAAAEKAAAAENSEETTEETTPEEEAKE